MNERVRSLKFSPKPRGWVVAIGQFSQTHPATYRNWRRRSAGLRSETTWVTWRLNVANEVELPTDEAAKVCAGADAYERVQPHQIPCCLLLRLDPLFRSAILTAGSTVLFFFYSVRATNSIKTSESIKTCPFIVQLLAMKRRQQVECNFKLDKWSAPSSGMMT